jgi:type IV pilus assembly protein PilZ
MKEKIDRRKHPRIFLRALVDYESQDTFIYDYSKDLSQGGIFIQTDKPLKINDVIELKFSLPDIAKVFNVKGEVKWTNTEEGEGLMKGMGIEFKDMSAEDRKMLQEYVHRANKNKD